MVEEGFVRARNAFGVRPVHRRKARVKALDSENPSR
jgi:hypothetical protein